MAVHRFLRLFATDPKRDKRGKKRSDQRWQARVPAFSLLIATLAVVITGANFYYSKLYRHDSLELTVISCGCMALTSNCPHDDNFQISIHNGGTEPVVVDSIWPVIWSVSGNQPGRAPNARPAWVPVPATTQQSQEPVSIPLPRAFQPGETNILIVKAPYNSYSLARDSHYRQPQPKGLTMTTFGLRVTTTTVKGFHTWVEVPVLNTFLAMQNGIEVGSAGCTAGPYELLRLVEEVPPYPPKRP